MKKKSSISMVFDLVPYKLQLLVQWDPVYLNLLGPGCIHSSGFLGSLSQALYTCINAIYIMKCKLIIYRLHKNQTTIL